MNKISLIFIIVEGIMALIHSYRKDYSQSTHSLCFIIITLLIEIYQKLK